MKEITQQFNMRLSKRLVEDMEFIAQSLGVNRNDWLKVKIAELISDEIEKTKSNLITTAEDKFTRGIISEQEFIKRRGSNPTNAMKIRRKAYKKHKNKLKKNAKLSLKYYLRSIAKKSESK